MDVSTRNAINRLARKTKNACIFLKRGGKQILLDLPDGTATDGKRFTYKGDEFTVTKVGLGDKDHVIYIGYQEEYDTVLGGLELLLHLSNDVLNA